MLLTPLEEEAARQINGIRDKIRGIEIGSQIDELHRSSYIGIEQALLASWSRNLERESARRQPPPASQRDELIIGLISDLEASFGKEYNEIFTTHPNALEKAFRRNRHLLIANSKSSDDTMAGQSKIKLSEEQLKQRNEKAMEAVERQSGVVAKKLKNLLSQEIVDRIVNSARPSIKNTTFRFSNTLPYKKIKNAVIDQRGDIDEAELWIAAIRAVAVPLGGKVNGQWKECPAISEVVLAMMDIIKAANRGSLISTLSITTEQARAPFLKRLRNVGYSSKLARNAKVHTIKAAFVADPEIQQSGAQSSDALQDEDNEEQEVVVISNKKKPKKKVAASAPSQNMPAVDPVDDDDEDTGVVMISDTARSEGVDATGEIQIKREDQGPDLSRFQSVGRSIGASNAQDIDNSTMRHIPRDYVSTHDANPSSHVRHTYGRQRGTEWEARDQMDRLIQLAEVVPPEVRFLALISQITRVLVTQLGADVLDGAHQTFDEYRRAVEHRDRIARGSGRQRDDDDYVGTAQANTKRRRISDDQ